MSKVILVADDDKGQVSLLESTLKSRGYDVLTAYDGQKALELAQKKRPDLILLDVQMPKLDGDEVYMTLRQNGADTRSIPILMITGLRTEAEIIANREENTFAKPVRYEQLLTRIREILG